MSSSKMSCSSIILFHHLTHLTHLTFLANRFGHFWEHKTYPIVVWHIVTTQNQNWNTYNTSARDFQNIQHCDIYKNHIYIELYVFVISVNILSVMVCTGAVDSFKAKRVSPWEPKLQKCSEILLFGYKCSGVWTEIQQWKKSLWQKKMKKWKKKQKTVNPNMIQVEVWGVKWELYS